MKIGPNSGWFCNFDQQNWKIIIHNLFSSYTIYFIHLFNFKYFFQLIFTESNSHTSYAINNHFYIKCEGMMIKTLIFFVLKHELRAYLSLVTASAVAVAPPSKSIAERRSRESRHRRIYIYIYEQAVVHLYFLAVKLGFAMCVCVSSRFLKRKTFF